MCVCVPVVFSSGIEALTSMGSANQSLPPVNRAVGTISSLMLYTGGVAWGREGEGALSVVHNMMLELIIIASVASSLVHDMTIVLRFVWYRKLSSD